jgi:hypothetical protein
MRERAIPFALREEVRKQIEMMLRNEIIETSTSSYVNPLTIIPRESKSPRICVDARRLNAVTIPDPEKCQPMTEMLQGFDSVKYLSSLDLTSAFLQIPLKSLAESVLHFFSIQIM